MADSRLRRARSNRKQPGFQRIADKLRQEIRRDYEPGDRLPTESELAARFKVSNLTIRQALTVLAQEGLIDRRQGSGTYVLDLHEARRHAAIYCELDLAHPSTSYYYRRLVRQLTLQLDEMKIPNRVYSGFHPAVGDVEPNRVTCRGFLHDLEMGRITGIIPVATNMFAEWTLPAREAGIPIVGAGYGQGVDIRTDEPSMYRMVADYFKEHGRRRIAYFGWGTSEPFRHAMAAADLATADRWIHTAAHPAAPGTGRRALEAIWSREPRPDALFIGDEAIWQDFVVGAYRQGLDMPQDLLLVLRTHATLPHLEAFPVARIETDVDELAGALAAAFAKRLEGRNLKRETTWIPFRWNLAFAD